MIDGAELELTAPPDPSFFVTTTSLRYTAGSPSVFAKSGTKRSRGTVRKARRTAGVLMRPSFSSSATRPRRSRADVLMDPFVPCGDMTTSRRAIVLCVCLLLLASCGREQWAVVAARQAASPVPTYTPPPRPTPKATPEPVEPTPRPEPVQAAAVPDTPSTPPPIPSTDLPGGPDGSDETKRDSGVRGQVLAGDRPVAD